MKTAALLLALAASTAVAAQPLSREVRLGTRVFDYASTDQGIAEYLPPGQTFEDGYSDMLSLLPVHDDDAYKASDVQVFTDRQLEASRARGGQLLSKACTAEECTIAKLYERDGYSEWSLARHVLANGRVRIALLSHREYDRGAKARALAWAASPAGGSLVRDFRAWLIPETRTDGAAAPGPDARTAPSSAWPATYDVTVRNGNTVVWQTRIRPGSPADGGSTPADAIGRMDPALYPDGSVRHPVAVKVAARIRGTAAPAPFLAIAIQEAVLRRAVGPGAALELPALTSFSDELPMPTKRGATVRRPLLMDGIVDSGYSAEITGQ